METPATATASTPIAMIPVRPVSFMRRTITRAVDRAEARARVSFPYDSPHPAGGARRPWRARPRHQPRHGPAAAPAREPVPGDRHAAGLLPPGRGLRPAPP